ncbi:MAG: cation transporter [Lachnospiraceae bacterium]|nr:cation transporter [Lachnospiraceae bacterium]
MIETTVSIEGMMCNMCETHVNETFRKKFDIKKVSADHKKKQAVIISEAELNEDEVKAAIDELGYDYLGISSKEYEKKGLFSKKK